MWTKFGDCKISFAKGLQILRWLWCEWIQLDLVIVLYILYSFDCLLSQKESQKLFDIAACKCQDYNNCNCPPGRKIPENKRIFLWKHRQSRTIYTVSRNKRIRISAVSSVSVESNGSTHSSPKSHVNSADDSDESPKRSYNTLKLGTVAEFADRFNISNVQTAAVATATLQAASK